MITDDFPPSPGCDNRLGGSGTAAVREGRPGGRLAGGRKARLVGGRQVASEGWGMGGTSPSTLGSGGDEEVQQTVSPPHLKS